MARNRHNGKFVFGALVGGAVGAITALWKTPYSGAELRGKLGLPVDAGAASSMGNVPPVTSGNSRPLTSRALAFVEQAAAPLVGVKLGQTANNSQPATPAPTTDLSPEPEAASSPDDLISDSALSDFPAQQPVGTTQG
jgi:hypothetical protein